MKTNRRIEVAAAVLVAVIGAVTAFGQGPSGTLRSTDGTTVNVAQLRGRVTVLFFGGQIDPQSPEELPVLQKLSERYAGRNVDVIWVSLDPEGDVSDAALPFMAIREMDLGMAPVILGRVSYTGDLGYEIWMRPEYQRYVFEALMEAGAEFDITLFGLRALNALRLEKSFGSWSRD